jgi:hypothetical protein
MPLGHLGLDAEPPEKWHRCNRRSTTADPKRRIDILARDRYGHRVIIEVKRSNQASRPEWGAMVPGAGLEPACPFGQTLLRRPRMPIPPSRPTRRCPSNHQDASSGRAPGVHSTVVDAHPGPRSRAVRRITERAGRSDHRQWPGAAILQAPHQRARTEVSDDPAGRSQSAAQ